MASVSDALKISFFIGAGFFLNLLAPSVSFSQPIKEIVVSKSGITSVLKNYPDSIIEDVQRNELLFPLNDSTKTSWYKIYLYSDCDVYFDIYPTGLGNTYNYRLYSKPNDITLQDIFSRKVKPIRENLYADAMYVTGIGLTKSSLTGSSNATISDSIKYIYHTCYHHSVAAKKGDVLLLEVFHVTGTDCGYHLALHANNSTQKFQSIYRSCYPERVAVSQIRYYSYQSDQMPEAPADKEDSVKSTTALVSASKSVQIDTINFPDADKIIGMLQDSDVVSKSTEKLNPDSRSNSNPMPSSNTSSSSNLSLSPGSSLNSNAVSETFLVENEDQKKSGFEIQKMNAIELPPVYEPNAIFIIKDSLSKRTIEADINVMNPKNSSTKVMVSQKGEYDLVLVRNAKYHFIFSSVGYKSKDIYFNTEDSIEAFESEIFLTPCKEGENFVMNNIYFYSNTYQMKQEGRAELDKLAYFLNNNPQASIEIQGHTNGNKRIRASYHESFKGSSKKLSQYRADFIKKYLSDKGIPGYRLKATGYGGKNMIYAKPKNQTQANKNIRVEIRILSQKENSLMRVAK